MIESAISSPVEVSPRVASHGRLAEWVTFLHTAVMATVVMCRVRNPACTAASALVKERYING